jgi:UPF0716 protein FxsA
VILLLFLLFTLLPVIEITLLIRVGSEIGVWPTIAIMILMGFVGAWLARREGRRTLLEVQRALTRGQMPTNEILEGFLIFLGGLLMVTPGFVTDLVGILFVFPPTRKLSLLVMKRFFAKRVRFQSMIFAPPPGHPQDFREMKDVTPRRGNSHPPGDTSRLTSL